MSREYRAKWRRPYRDKAPKRIPSTRALFMAAKLYKRGVKRDDREALLAAQWLLDMLDREETDR